MTQTGLEWAGIEELAEALRDRVVSPLELTRDLLDRIGKLNPRLHALITVDAEGAISAAREAEARLAANGPHDLLLGIPISVKDHYATQGVRTTVASELFADFVPDHDAAVVTSLKRAGAVIIGKANMYELGSGWGTFGHFPVAENPWSAAHTPGGSSSGSAAAVAAGLGAGSVASDGGGSTRVPANYCGVVGLKATHGRVSMFGSIPEPSVSDRARPAPAGKSISAVGVITRAVRDAAILLGAIAGFDARDGGSARRRVPDLLAACSGDVRGIRIGVPWAYIDRLVASDNRAAFAASLDVLAEAGAAVHEIAEPASLARIGEMWETSAYTEMAAMYGAWLKRSPGSIGPEMTQRIRAGLATTRSTYGAAQRMRSKLRAEFTASMREVDVVATPSAPAGPPTMDELRARASNLQDVGSLARFTRPYNMTGFPAISVPNGFTHDGLPLGLHIGGRAWDEATIVRVADAYQRRTGWHQRHPAVDGNGDATQGSAA